MVFTSVKPIVAVPYSVFLRMMLTVIYKSSLFTSGIVQKATGSIEELLQSLNMVRFIFKDIIMGKCFHLDVPLL